MIKINKNTILVIKNISKRYYNDMGIIHSYEETKHDILIDTHESHCVITKNDIKSAVFDSELNSLEITVYN